MKWKIFSSKVFGSVVMIIFISLLSCNNKESKSETEAEKPLPDTMASKETMDTMFVPTVKHAEAILSGTYPDTAVNGTVKFDEDSTGKIKMTLEMTIPSKAGKTVAVHIHEHGDCGDTAKLAHGHWNPTNAQHGKWGSSSFHLGDIGNVKLNAKGKGTMTLTTDLWSLGGRYDKNILGKSIIVHGGMDDYKTQPTGNAGSRIGCGVIK